MALASLADFIVPGTSDAAGVFDELRALEDPRMAPFARCTAPIAEVGHLSKLGHAAAAIACLERGLALISETGYGNGILITHSWLIGIKLAAGSTDEVLADEALA